MKKYQVSGKPLSGVRPQIKQPQKETASFVYLLFLFRRESHETWSRYEGLTRRDNRAMDFLLAEKTRKVLNKYSPFTIYS